jgi:hypothetical protein
MLLSASGLYAALSALREKREKGLAETKTRELFFGQTPTFFVLVLSVSKEPDRSAYRLIHVADARDHA